jgi:WD40 repeat protein
MHTTPTNFYVTGGTLQRDAPSYVERQADRDLFEGLSRGDFCYVLTARQMGKSSLVAHTTAGFRAVGAAVVNLDLTAIGQNLSVEQWYDGLLAKVGRDLALEDELEEHWLEHERLGPLQRWMSSLREVVLRVRVGRVVLFVDEIDAVQSLPFSTDEFFAAIRECYNRRAEDPEFGRLSFCLLGVASPSDLIRDPRTTPFNIGKRIELTDFTPAEAAPLAGGLGREEPLGATLLQRVLYWTGGHPYLTQRLCQALTEDPSATAAASVDRVCEGLFLSHRARERDTNLLFVSDWLLRSATEVSHLLSLYARVHSPRQKVPDDETDPLVGLLRLSGIVREQDGYLQVRNRIYARVFDRAWIETHMPDAELRRLRALAREEARKRRQAEEREGIARRYLYVAEMNLAQQAWKEGRVRPTLDLLEAQRPAAGQEELRGFEWRYLWRLCQQDDALFTLRGHTSEVTSVAFSPSGAILATGSGDQSVKLWDLALRRERCTLLGHQGRVAAVAFSPDGTLLATAGGDHAVRLWSLDTHREVAILEGHSQQVEGVAFSPRGSLLASASLDGTVKLWDVHARREVATLPKHVGYVLAVAFSPEGTHLALASGEIYDVASTILLWEFASQQVVARFQGHQAPVRCLAFAPNGTTLASGSSDHMVKLWDLTTSQEPVTLRGHDGGVLSVAFSPDGRLLASGSDDSMLRLWDVEAHREMVTLRGHQAWVRSVAFSPDGRTLATGSGDKTAKLWSIRPREDSASLKGHRARVRAIAISPDSQMVASGSFDKTVKLWDITTRQEIASLQGHTIWIEAIAFSPDGKTLASVGGFYHRGDHPGEVKLWDVAAQRELASLTGHEGPVMSVTFSPDGKLLATGGRDPKLWDLATCQELATFPAGENTSFLSLSFSPDGHTLATGGSDRSGLVKLWDVAECLQGRWRERAILRGHMGSIYSLAFSPDSKRLATGSQDGAVKLWDVDRGREVASLPIAVGGIMSVALSPDGKTLAVGGNRAAVKLWNLAAQREVASLEGHQSSVTSVAFSADGRVLASGSDDGTVRLWRAASFAETDRETRRSR